MTQQDRELGELRRHYRAVKAPPYLATRIRASVGLSQRPGWRWRAALVSGIAVVALIVAVPLSKQDSPPASGPSYPSLTGISGTLPSRPAAPMPSLADVTSLSIPSLPSLPPMPTGVEPRG